mmetsp:Transcript_153515/g.270933  ORF Transcript_153515/g.270933 Transcript_153515/m.270933 type:complete len:86 (-) Transcript_153515:235-492(-)
MILGLFYARVQSLDGFSLYLNRAFSSSKLLSVSSPPAWVNLLQHFLQLLCLSSNLLQRLLYLLQLLPVTLLLQPLLCRLLLLPII